MLKGWYYLHTNGELIYKVDIDDGMVADFRESPFVVAFWPVDPEDREGAWNICVEALAAGAKHHRVNELKVKWSLDDDDAQNYAERIGAKIFKDGTSFCATRAHGFVNLVESPAGFGDSALEALAALCKALGYRPQKLWGATFKQLLERRNKNGNKKGGPGEETTKP